MARFQRGDGCFGLVFEAVLKWYEEFRDRKPAAPSSGWILAKRRFDTAPMTRREHRRTLVRQVRARYAIRVRMVRVLPLLSLRAEDTVSIASEPTPKSPDQTTPSLDPGVEQPTSVHGDPT